MEISNNSFEPFELPPNELGAPSWPIALLFPMQGDWTEPAYLSLHYETNARIELSNGQIEVLPMASVLHQRILLYLYETLKACVLAANAGEVLVASLPIRLGPGNYRDPDVVFLKPGRVIDPKRQPQGADLIIEVVSGKKIDRDRDYETKRFEYARAGVAEYWIVDPEMELITVLVLNGDVYDVSGEFRPAAVADSVLLPGFSVAVSDVLAAGNGS